MGELARSFEGILVLYTDDLVVNLGVEHIRNEACADALNFVRAALAGGQDRRGVRLNGNNLDVRVLVLEVLGTDACNKNIDLAVGLLPDLRAGGRIVRGRVCRVDELTRDKAVRGLLRKLICLRDRAGHTLCALGQNQLRAVGLEHIAALDGHGLGHGEDDAVAAGRRDSRQTDAGVAGGRLDDGSPRL